MDPWSFGSEGKGLLFSDEVDFPFDACPRSRKALMEWDIMKPSYSFENDGLEKVEFMELGFTDITGKHFLEKPALCELGSVSSKQVASPTCIITPNSSFGEVESEIGWKLSGSITECNSRDSSLIDLQLGSLGDCNMFSKERSSGGKRARTSTSSYSQTPFCQVQGCNMNLSFSKDYHKRHRVCVAHSKTSRVIVNGIEQRFCQQCSRFHLLAEFDDGKRSCRKRLAGHNERRRKPLLDSFSGESHKFLQSIEGARFLGDSFSKRDPFVGIVYPDKYNECPLIKFDERSPQLARSFQNIGKQYRSGITPSAFSGSSDSSCALSLLSTQSQDLLSFQADDVGAQIFGKTFCSSLPNSTGIDHIMLPNTIDMKGIFQGWGFSNSKPQQGTTVDLLQLSSRLQRVEQRRSCVQENEDLFGFLTT